MLLASKNGDIAAANLIRETKSGWLLEVEGRSVRVSKSCNNRRAYDLMSDALVWAGAEEELIAHFLEVERNELESRLSSS
jgi:hypothetical protein